MTTHAIQIDTCWDAMYTRRVSRVQHGVDYRSVPVIGTDLERNDHQGSDSVSTSGTGSRGAATVAAGEQVWRRIAVTRILEEGLASMATSEILETRGDMKQCPFCAEDILAAAKKCNHCGSMLSEATPAIPSGFESEIQAARSALTHGDLEAAGQHFNQVYDSVPESPVGRISRGIACVIKGDIDTGYTYFSRIEQEQKEPTKHEQELMAIGYALIGLAFLAKTGARPPKSVAASAAGFGLAAFAVFSSRSSSLRFGSAVGSVVAFGVGKIQDMAHKEKMFGLARFYALKAAKLDPSEPSYKSVAAFCERELAKFNAIARNINNAITVVVIVMFVTVFLMAAAFIILSFAGAILKSFF